MSEITDLLAAPPVPPPAKCGFRDWFVLQSEKDQEAIEKALANPQWNAVDLTKALKPKGLPVKESRLKAHRRGECSCGRQYLA